MTSSARIRSIVLLFGLALFSAGLFGGCAPKPAPSSSVETGTYSFEDQVSQFETQLKSPDGLKLYLDPVAATKAKAFSWSPTGRSSNEIMFHLRQAKKVGEDRDRWLARCLTALADIPAKSIIDDSPEPRGRERLGAILTPASELLDELRLSEIAPKAAMLAQQTINFYMDLTPGGSTPDSGPPPTSGELNKYDELRQQWKDYAKHFLK